MKLNEIKGMSHYLENDCYCPGEIYDRTGFFYRVYKGEDECSFLGERGCMKFVICGDQILAITSKDDKIYDVTRLDATENNIKEFKENINCNKSKITIDEFEKGATKKSLKEIMGMVDAIMVD